MISLQSEVANHIRKLTRPLKDEEELYEILKKRLTKREFKLLDLMCQNASEEMISESLGLSTQEVVEFHNKFIKKLNQEKLKHEIML